MSPYRRPLPGHPGVEFVSLAAAEAAGLGPLSSLPISLRVVAENILRTTAEHGELENELRALTSGSGTISLRPERLLLQDASGIPVLADLITLREAVARRGGAPRTVSPSIPMDLIVDHALEVDRAGHASAAEHNLRREHERHRSRLEFLDWAAAQLPGLRVIPPGMGICHQLNLEVLAQVVHLAEPGLAVLDTVLGTDSHTTMINGLSVVGWGIGGIEAMAAAVRHPVAIPAPEVLGVQLTGRLPAGVLAFDLALMLTSQLRDIGVVGTFVEFCGPGVATLPVPDRATVANMAPEYGATVAYFPPDDATLSYLAVTGRPQEHIRLTRDYLLAQRLLGTADSAPQFTRSIEFDLGSVERTMAGPSRPAERRNLQDVAQRARSTSLSNRPTAPVQDGDVAIAAITSCTNTSNPRAMIAAGLLARNARERGLRTAPMVKTSLTPGSHSASALLAEAGLQQSLDELGFQVAGHGCATCMGNSGPLVEAVEAAVADGVRVSAVLSGNRNFPGRIHPSIAEAYLSSPPLVVAAAIAGSMRIDLASEPLGVDPSGVPVYLVEVWPSDDEIEQLANSAPAARVLARSAQLAAPRPVRRRSGQEFQWQGEAGMIRRPPFAGLDEREATGWDSVADILEARPLLLLGDGVTTDDISPVGQITPDSAAGRWLSAHGVTEPGSFASRRLNHDVMIRGGFANPRLVNRLAADKPGGWTRTSLDGRPLRVHEAAEHYRDARTATVVVAGDSYGVGSARDWAAKVTRLLGIRAVLAVGFERIHRTNLIALGVLPVRVDRALVDLLVGDETLDLRNVCRAVTAGDEMTVVVKRSGDTLGAFVGAPEARTLAEKQWLQVGGLIPHLIAGALSPT